MSVSTNQEAVKKYEKEIPWKIEEENDVEEFFKHRASYYDRHMDGIYNGPTRAAAELAMVMKNKEGSILDVAAGTGLVGQAMHNQGFTNITALDRSESMLEQAALKKVYTILLQGTFEVKAKEIPDKSFDTCICIGAFLTGGFLEPDAAILEMIRLVKECGIVLLMVNKTELEEPECSDTKEGLERICNSVVKDGVCELVKKAIILSLSEDCDGLMWIFKRK